MTRSRLFHHVVLGLAAAALLAGCVDDSPSSSNSSRSTPTTPSESASSATPTATASPADPLADLTPAQVVGQVLMTGTEATAASEQTRSAVREHHVGNVMLRGRGTAGVEATAKIVDRLRDDVDDESTDGVPLLIATDQEGGLVQVLRGKGFTDIPRALTQGGWPAATLRKRAARWGAELRDAGVDLNLAPVLDTVPGKTFAERNAPIGYFDRQYGFTPAVVARQGLAFGAGMEDARVIAAYKHFPGLGRVTQNTDTESGVHDATTRADDPYLAPFKAAIAADAQVIMMATAIYDRIDRRHPAAFSHKVVTGLLRERLGYDGVVISDDLSAAAQVSDRPPGQRAVDFLRAGGDLVLAVDAAQMPAMAAAVTQEMDRDAAFRARVEEAAARVLTLKQDHFGD